MAIVGSDSNMLSEMYFKVGPGVVLLATAIVLTKEFVIVLVRLLVVAQDPIRFEFLAAALKGADFLWLLFTFCMSRHMVSQMLGTFEHFITALNLTHIIPDGEML